MYTYRFVELPSAADLDLQSLNDKKEEVLAVNTFANVLFAKCRTLRD